MKIITMVEMKNWVKIFGMTLVKVTQYLVEALTKVYFAVMH